MTGSESCPFCLFEAIDKDELASHLDACSGRLGHGGIDALRATADNERLRDALRACRELFVELRGDWSDNRGPCREGFAIIDGALGGSE